MKEQGIFSAFTLSLFMHILVIVITGAIARHSISFHLPSPYIVSLVDVSSVPGSPGGKTIVGASGVEEPSRNEQHLIEKPTRRDNTLVDERISALLAKKRLERMAALRKIVNVGSHKSASQAAPSTATARSGGAGGAPGGDYYSLVENRIRQQWVFPESLDRDLEAIISIKIAKDGSVIIDKMEKSSGNHLFDRSVLRAINKANPLPPPPQEMEMGLRFKP